MDYDEIRLELMEYDGLPMEYDGLWWNMEFNMMEYDGNGEI